MICYNYSTVCVQLYNSAFGKSYTFTEDNNKMYNASTQLVIMWLRILVSTGSFNGNMKETFIKCCDTCIIPSICWRRVTLNVS